MKIESQKHIDALDKNLLKTCIFASQCIAVEISKRDKKKYIRIRENASFFRQELSVLGVSPNADKNRIYPYDWDTNKYKEKYNDLVEFMSAFWEEWATLYEEFQPGAIGSARNALRDRSYALSNIIFFPMFRLAMELWEKYDKKDKNWRNETEWKVALQKLAGEITINDPSHPNHGGKVALMAKEIVVKEKGKIKTISPGNPEWRGVILVKKLDKDGNEAWGLSSTSQTRHSAYIYLRKRSGVDLESEK